MKKSLKILGLVLLALALITLTVALLQPKDLSVVRSIEIKARPEVVFNQVKNFKNWPHWSPWLAKEPNAKLYYIGVDGEVGSAYHWKGDELGEGEMTATHIGANNLEYRLKFIAPWEGDAEGTINLEDLGNGKTKVKWSMLNHGTFPFNAFNILMEKFIGKDFEEGLENLKNYAEQHPNLPLSVSDIVEKDFPSNLYASLRKKVPFSEVQLFSTQAYNQLSAACKNRIKGVPTCIFYDWDQKAQMADMAPAFAVDGQEPVSQTEMVKVGGGKSCQILYKGAYSGIAQAHELMGQYVTKKGAKLSFVLEEYLSGPATEADSNLWQTNVIYIYK